MVRLTAIKRRNEAVICSTWSDGFESCILLADLRDACPCAHCTGEEIMGETVFSGIKMFAPGMNELVGLSQVGNYALQASWKDGHSTGLYTWELLRDVFENKKLSEATLKQIDLKVDKE